MPRLLSGSTLRRGGSGEFINLRDAMPQLPPTETTATGFTLATDPLFRTTYRSSLGFIEFTSSSMYSALPQGTIKVLATGTSFLSTSTMSGTLVVQGGVGIGANMHVKEDIVVNEVTIGKGWTGKNNLVFRGTATVLDNDFNEGQNSIAIGYDTLKGLQTSFKTIAIGTDALSSGTNLRESIAIGNSAFKRLGIIDEIQVATITNIILSTSTAITGVTNESPLKITAVGHGLTTGTQVYVTGVDGITTSTPYTGLYSLINEQVLYVDVINSNTLAVYYNSTLTVAANATDATPYISSGTLYTPTILTVVPTSKLMTGLLVNVDSVVGTAELNGNDYYIKELTTTTYALYVDPIFEKPVDGTVLTSYVSGGRLKYFVSKQGNVSYGHNAGENLIEGSNNVFLGNDAARSLTTGSNNVFIGNNRAYDVFTGSGIISIAGDNIVNGLDNQINIGSVYYYNGTNLNEIRSSETKIGLGLNATDINSGALQVLGGAGITNDLYVGNELHVQGSGILTSTIATNLIVLADLKVNQAFTVIGSEEVNISPSANVTIQTQGAGKITLTSGSLGPGSQGNIDNIYIGETVPAPGRFTSVQVVDTTTNAISTTTGALTVAGGVGIRGDIYSNTGNIDENYLLYTPRVTVSAGVPPNNPRIGDLWIDSSVPAYLQYIKDGTSTFWIQVGAV